MKKDNMASLDPAAMETRLKEIEEQTFRIRFQMSMGQTDGLRKMREMRKDKARLMTYLRQSEIRQRELKGAK